MPKHYSHFTESLKVAVKLTIERMPRTSLVLNVWREFDDVTSSDKLFHVHARNPGDWLNGVSQVGRSKSTDALVHHDGELEEYPLHAAHKANAGGTDAG